MSPTKTFDRELRVETTGFCQSEFRLGVVPLRGLKSRQKGIGNERSVPCVNCSLKLHNRRVTPTQAISASAQHHVPDAAEWSRGLRPNACLICPIDCSQRPRLNSAWPIAEYAYAALGSRGPPSGRPRSLPEIPSKPQHEAFHVIGEGIPGLIAVAFVSRSNCAA